MLHSATGRGPGTRARSGPLVVCADDLNRDKRRFDLTFVIRSVKDFPPKNLSGPRPLAAESFPGHCEPIPSPRKRPWPDRRRARYRGCGEMQRSSRTESPERMAGVGQRTIATNTLEIFER